MKTRFIRRNLFKLGLAASATSILPLLSGCNNSESTRLIRMGVNTRVRMLDPRKATDALSSRINRLIYRQLIDFDAHFQPRADLADWQQLSPTHYRFTLTPSRFHNGEQLNAEDVVATYRSVLDPNFGSAHRGSLKVIKEVTAHNSNQVDFILNEPDPLFVGRLVIGVLPKSLIEKGHAFHEEPVGSGPCRFISMNEQKLVLQRSDNVLLEFVPVKDATVRVLKLIKGELDIVQNDLSPELVGYCQKQPELQVDWHNGTNFGYVGFNFEDELLAQKALRQAIAMGIDRQAVIDALFNGHARLAGGLLVPEHWCGVKDIHGFDYDPERAKALLKQVKISTGLLNSNGMIELSYKTSNDPTRIRLATIYQSQLKKIGIQLKIQSYDWGTFYSDIKQGRFQLYSLAWVGVKSPDIFQYVFDSEAVPPKGANRGRYRDPEADRLIRKAATQQSLEAQAQTYQQLQRHLQDDLAALPLWYEDQYAVSRANVAGYELYSDGRLDGLLKVRKMLS
ncbi:ABC transporter substrate-binding protein [Thiomicrorhabdus sp. ZW0627]|uniref:ABC transporter substrate-binding protein n=1 Tax=Thiomicrorhabdus sp. ZW0627 TaxID=3039774 RepID=UPI002436E14B|nr:ABC transporter substrate-binding protein [Thiomicrorhabdus sp. ZW0627]MDG6773029.1 ABC transporter substrate-binding protein [Thiomicrorhabdus sp. ZW0627]